MITNETQSLVDILLVISHLATFYPYLQPYNLISYIFSVSDLQINPVLNTKKPLSLSIPQSTLSISNYSFLNPPIGHIQVVSCHYNYQLSGVQMLKKQQSEYQVNLASESQQVEVKSRRLLKAMREENSDLKFYSWDFKENYTYITYLKNFRHIFNSHEDRKRAKVFTHISKLLNTRNPHQIKSHHQKMMMRHKSIEGIIDYLRIKIIKYLKGSPESVKDIERINEHCEAFYQRESAVHNRLRGKDRENKEMEGGNWVEELNGKEAGKVKLQDSMNGYEYESIKNTQNLNESPKTSEVKVEEGTEGQYHAAK